MYYIFVYLRLPACIEKLGIDPKLKYLFIATELFINYHQTSGILKYCRLFCLIVDIN